MFKLLCKLEINRQQNGAKPGPFGGIFVGHYLQMSVGHPSLCVFFFLRLTVRSVAQVRANDVSITLFMSVSLCPSILLLKAWSLDWEGVGNANSRAPFQQDPQVTHVHGSLKSTALAGR